jgi:hypothetical protein
MRSQGANPLPGPAVAIAGRQLVPVENAGDQIIICDQGKLADGLDCFDRRPVALPAPPAWQAQVGVDAANPVNDQNDLSGTTCGLGNNV